MHLHLKVERTKRLNEIKKKWILRRTKEIIKDQLPKKSKLLKYSLN